MRAFVLVCFVALASAQYNYGPQSHVNNNGPLDGSNSDALSVANQPVVEEYNKAFYSYSAPEQEFDDLNAGEHIANALKKNLRVIFIKGPENTALENAALQLAKGAADDRTAIYVLSKQSDIGALANQLQQLKANNAVKPEVHFVKYRTQADAENAQRTIQSQYDSLPGATSSNGPSSASVLDFASKSASPSAINNAAASAPAATPTAAPARSYIPSRHAYLPPSKRF
ncbi:hypothetical protein FF38_04971 [Lucilia cuprina]|uniref:DUF243 domain-containing protein n=1 Tax=Lucilia cuprina TaxID=7375 RepID=A0A0L0CJ54_LUCCU|nr:hypothetical protein CVS40_0646 [Lucilia cuprina]KNC32413.1 hypothetical protein FF38_04971 [Lucilia cuprina]